MATLFFICDRGTEQSAPLFMVIDIEILTRPVDN